MNNLGRASLVKSKVASLGIPKSYQRLGGFPLDDSTVFASLMDRDAMVEGVRYAGMITYVEETEEMYILKGGISNACWVPLSTTETKKVLTYTAGGDILFGQVLHMEEDGTVSVADASNRKVCVIGIALDSVSEGEEVPVQVADEATVLTGDQALVIGKNCFLGHHGQVIQSLADLTVMQPLGVAVSEDSIMVSIDNDPIMLIEEN